MKKERLLKLADHLESGKLGHRFFRFRNLNQGPFDSNGCGTSGCALGEMPFVDPENWNFNVDFTIPAPALRESIGGVLDDAAKYFDITMSACSHLFYPHAQDTEIFGGKHLSSHAKKEEVAANIRAFVSEKERPE